MNKLIAIALAAAIPASPAFAAESENQEPDIGRFAGSYTCQDGEHGLYLQISVDENDGEVAKVSGILSFFPTLSGKDGPVGMAAGSFAVSGTITRSTMAVAFQPGEWLLKPDGYGAAALEGTFSETADGLSQIIGKPVIAGNPDYCSDLIVTELMLKQPE